MPKDLPASLILEKNKTATASAWLVLLEITLTDTTVYRLARSQEDVTFDGDVYNSFNFQLDPMVQNSAGEIPSLVLRVSNITHLIEAKLQELDGGMGSTIKIIVVNSALLAENHSELVMEFNVLGCTHDVEWVSFTLGAPSPLNLRFPLHKYLALHCSWRFRSAECAYIGVGDTCERTLKACREYVNSPRFGGFPGLRSGGIRIV